MARPVKHGRNRWMNYGCRCDECAKGLREFNDKRNAERKAYRELNYLDFAPLDAVLKDKAHGVWREFRGNYAKWRQNGIHIYTADRVCVRAGFHPTEVYGSEFYKGAFSEETV